MSAESFFEYPVTRRYPAKLTWIILVGGTILITLFTFLAVAGNAYELDSRYTNDYNATIANKTWYQRQTFSWATDMETKCQPALLTIGGDHTTTNQGFHHEIESFRHETNASSIPLTASYRNGSLNTCQVQEIVIEFTRTSPTRFPRNRWTWGSTIARSTTQCLMDTDDGPMSVNFTSQLPSAGHYGDIPKSFLGLNDSSHPGRYLGAEFLAARYDRLSMAMGYSVPKDSESEEPKDDSDLASWASGTVTLTRNIDVSDYKSPEFFHCTASFPQSRRGLSSMRSSRTMKDWRDQWTPEAKANDRVFKLPDISIIVDVFGKTYYSLLLSDFNSTDEVKLTNALSTGDGLQYLQNINDTSLAEAIMQQNDTDSGKGTIDQKFDPATANFTQPLDFAQHTTLFSRYLCSIPHSKSAFKLLFAVVLADFVFISACWTGFGWVAMWWLGRKNPNLDHCIGCVNAGNNIPLARTPGSGIGGSYFQVYSDAEDEQRASASRLSSPRIARVHSGL